MAEKEKEDRKYNKQPSINIPSVNSAESKNNKNTANNKTQKTHKKEEEMYKSKKGLGVLEYTNIVLALCAIGSLILVYSMTSKQNEISLKALKTAETSNFLTRQSLELTKKTADSTNKFTRQSLSIADSSMKISKNIASIQEKMGRIANRAYIVINNDFRANQPIQKGVIPFIQISYKNVGKTPACNTIAMETYFLIQWPTPITWDSVHKLIDLKVLSTFPFIALGIGDSSSQIINYNRVLTAEKNTTITKLKFIYYYIRISYNDIFGRKHLTEMILFYNGLAMPPNLSNWGSHND